MMSGLNSSTKLKPYYVPKKDVYKKVVIEKPKLLVNNVISSIKVGDRTKMILKDSSLG